MKWFKFGWFSSKEREDLLKQNDALQKEKDLLEQRIKSLEEKNVEKEKIDRNKPYSNIFYSGNQITVVFKDGEVLSVPDVNQETLELVKSSNTKGRIKEILAKTYIPTPKDEIEDTEEREEIKQNFGIFKEFPQFKVEGSDVYLTRVKLPMPAMVISSFAEILEKIKYGKTPKLEDQLQALTMFWLKISLNPIDQSRKDLLRFVKKNDVTITINGNLVLYRRIVSLSTENQELIAFISKEYYKIKKVWKKGVNGYYVWAEADGTYTLHKGKCTRKSDGIGRFEGYLGELYNKLSEMKDNKYTSKHNSGKHTIQIGTIYKIDETEINLNNSLCAAGGLHAAAVNYDYSGFGDVPVVVLVNPSKAITVPTGETGKLRTTEMFIAAINDKPFGLHFDEDALSAFDEEYNDYSIEELEEAVKNKSFDPITIKKEIAPITFDEMVAIKDLLQKRVTTI